MNNQQTKKLQELIKEFKEYDYSFVDKKTNYLFEYDCLDSDGSLENNIDERIDKANDIFDFIESKNHQLLIKLNNLLDEKDKDTDINKLEQEMKIIQVKKYITVDEFEKIFNISKSSQRDLRSKLRNPLPYHQKIAKGKIVYVVEEVEKWFENQYK
ncbi:hypothetical protein PJV99_04525 [Aliarcobacter butzleri]|uniref:helix-turn-helix transcriptional regulator n=1 Tax=Aliarcobacter butzleri TaxID=28197 RepID=UPI00263D1A88|nr:hypothetical protein [Aliarcobacter butzleri]MDN5109393.1 hypothetical protein [Aliarcobacter butzleri]